MLFSLLMNIQFLYAADDALPGYTQQVVAQGYYYGGISANVTGSLVVTASEDKIQIGDVDHVKEGRSLFATAIKQKNVSSLAVMPEEEHTFFSANKDDSIIKLWDVRTSKVEQTFKDTNKQIDSLSVLPEGHLLVEGGFYGDYTLWNMQSKMPVEEFNMRSEFRDHSRMLINPRSDKKVVISADMCATVFQVNLSEITDFLALAKCFAARVDKKSFYDTDSSVCIVEQQRGMFCPGGLDIGHFSGDGPERDIFLPFYEPRCFMPKKGLVLASVSNYIHRGSVAKDYPKYLNAYDEAQKNKDKLLLFDIDNILNHLRKKYADVPQPTLDECKTTFQSLGDEYSNDEQSYDARPYQGILKIIKEREESGKTTKACRS